MQTCESVRAKEKGILFGVRNYVPVFVPKFVPVSVPE